MSASSEKFSMYRRALSAERTTAPLWGFTSTTFMSASSRRALRIVSGDTPYSDASTDRP
jgi:hypothetical protein